MMFVVGGILPPELGRVTMSLSIAVAAFCFVAYLGSAVTAAALKVKVEE